MNYQKLLKIKLKSLAAEAKIINKEASRSHGGVKNSMIEHKKKIVRPASRNSHIAYGIIRGLRYDQIEKPREHNEPNWKEVARMIAQYGNESRYIQPPKALELLKTYGEASGVYDKLVKNAPTKMLQIR